MKERAISGRECVGVENRAGSAFLAIVIFAVGKRVLPADQDVSMLHRPQVLEISYRGRSR